MKKSKAAKKGDKKGKSGQKGSTDTMQGLAESAFQTQG